MPPPGRAPDALVEALRAAGCVFAEDEAAVLRASARDEAELARMLRRRVAGDPLEHVVGWVEFGALRLRVGPGVFVPRQRTRLLATTSVARMREFGPGAVFVEAFAGVAPVAATVRAAVPQAEIHVTDVDTVALGFARMNLGGPTGVHAASVLDGLPARLRGRVAVIAAVPPYVPDAAVRLLPREAREFEPSTALLGGDDGLDQVRVLIDQAVDYLDHGGRLLVEVGCQQAAAAQCHGERAGFRVRRRLGAQNRNRTCVLDLEFRAGAGSL